MSQHPLVALTVTLLVIVSAFAFTFPRRDRPAPVALAVIAPRATVADPPAPPRLEPHLAWQATVGDGPGTKSSELIGERVLVPGEHELVAFERATGKQAWRVDRYYGWGVVMVGDALIVDHDHGLEAVDPVSGQPRWRLELAPLGLAEEGENSDGAISVVDGCIYLTTRKELLAVDARSGELRWRSGELGFDVAIWHAGSPLLVTVGRAADQLVQLDPATGRKLAERAFSSTTVDSAAGAAQQWRVALADDPILIATDAEGRVAGRIALPSAAPTKPDARDHVFPAPPAQPDGFATLSVSGDDADLATRVDYPCGWQLMGAAEGESLQGFERDGDTLVAITHEHIVALTATGERRWSVPCRCAPSGWSVVGRTLWCGTTQGEVVAVDLASGAELARVDLNRLPEAQAAPKVVLNRGGQRWSCVGEVACAADARGVCAHTASGWVVTFAVGQTF
jgi:outer membrane protein assembly factor BamB